MSRKKRSREHWKTLAALPDYGEHAGVGSSNLPSARRLIIRELLPGWRDAVTDQPGGARLVRFADAHGEDSADFKRVLGQWIRQREDRGLAVPPTIGYDWKPI